MGRDERRAFRIFLFEELKRRAKKSDLTFPVFFDKHGLTYDTEKRYYNRDFETLRDEKYLNIPKHRALTAEDTVPSSKPIGDAEATTREEAGQCPDSTDETPASRVPNHAIGDRKAPYANLAKSTRIKVNGVISVITKIDVAEGTITLDVKVEEAPKPKEKKVKKVKKVKVIAKKTHSAIGKAKTACWRNIDDSVLITKEGEKPTCARCLNAARKKEANKKATANPVVAPKGGLKTGDKSQPDENGYYFVFEKNSEKPYAVHNDSIMSAALHSVKSKAAYDEYVAQLVREGNAAKAKAASASGEIRMSLNDYYGGEEVIAEELM